MSQCSCIKKDYDFSLSQVSCSSIIYTDRSTWDSGPDYALTPSYTLVVETPSGGEKEFEITVGTSTKLDLGDCPTGIYKFSVTTCTDKFYKHTAILCNLWCGYLKAFAKIGKGVDNQFIRDIRERLESIPMSVSYGDIITAQQDTEFVTRELRRVECSCSCF